ncbi:MAG: hypothetical protein LBP58_03185 [Azoarcus sp.]|jgi:hypothetical protein|nr:hypothetical protein [Azoarcus sp.]
MAEMTIINRGQVIEKTDYFDTPQARAGFLFLSWNAGAARILLPDSQAHMLREMKTGKTVIISRGPLVDHDGRDAIELLFEDDSDAPFSAHLLIEQTDRNLPETNQGGGFVVTVWSRHGGSLRERLRLPGKYRTVASLPCLEPWISH